MKTLFNITIVACGCLAASLLAGGFVFGFVNAGGCDWSLLGILGRLFIGVLYAFLTPIFCGFPPQNEAGVGEPFNVWPYAAPIFALLLSVTLGVLHRQMKKQKTSEVA